MEIKLKQFNNIVFWGDHSGELKNPLIHNSDLNIANLECSINVKGEKKEKAFNLSFEYSVSLEHALKQYDIFSIANNHSMDSGRLSFTNQIVFLNNLGLSLIGTKQKPFIDLVLESKKIRVVSCFQKASRISDLIYSSEDLLLDIQSLRTDCEYLIVYIHWGIESEYVLIPEPSVVKLANKLANHGVDLIIGSHPHVPQVYERINNTIVYYSIGNASFFVSEGEKYLYSKIGLCVALSKNLIPQHKCFTMDEKGNIIDFNNYNIIYSEVSKFYFYPFLFLLLNANIYITKNSRAFFRRIELFGIRHLIIFILWLIHPTTIKYLLFFPISCLLSSSKLVNKFKPF